MPRLMRFSRLSRLLLAAAPLAALLVLPAGCTCGSGPYEGDYFDGDRPGSLKNVKFVESAKGGDPAVVGCADGQREGFADLKKNPRVAGCMGTWDGAKSLQAKSTGKACGDDGEKCAVPADVCSPGWNVCGAIDMAKDLRDHTSVKECHNAGPGRFNAAVSHSPSEEINPCPKITTATKLKCVSAGLGSEPVCCGNDCKYGKCKDGVWKGKTQISRGTSEGCGAVTSKTNGGVMCCYGGEGDPAPGGDAKADAKADTKAAADGAAAEGGDAPAAEGGDAAAEGGDAKADAKVDAEADAKGDAKVDAKVDAKLEVGGKIDAKVDAKVDGKAD